MRSPIRWLLLCIWMAAQVAAWAGVPAASNPMAAFDDARLGAVAGVLPSFDLTHRHLRLKGSQIRVSAVVGGGNTLGFYFQGPVQVEYQSENVLEYPRFDYNLRNSTPLKPIDMASKRFVYDTVREGIIWCSDVEAMVLAGMKDEAPAVQMEAAFQVLKRRNRAGGITPAGFSLAMTGAGPEPFVAEMLGDRRWLYQDDSRDSAEESLVLLLGWKNRTGLTQEAEVKDMLRTCVISRQRNDRGWKQLDRPPYLLTHVRMDLKVQANDQVTMTVEETLIPMKAGLRSLQLNLENTIISRDRMGLKNRELNLRGVKDGAGRSIDYVHRAGRLFLLLPEAPPPNQALNLTFEVDGDFLIRWGGDNKWDLRPGNWFPQPEWNGQYYTVDARIAVQKPFLPCASANTVSRSEEGGFNVLVARCEKPVQFFSVTAGNLKFSEETRKGLTVRVANYAMVNAQTPRVIGFAFDVIDFYETILGPFPFTELTIVEQNDWGYGQAPPGLIFITKEAFNSILTRTHQIYSKGINARFAHEIAHQYWGAQVKMPSPEEQWVTEAFAEYSAALFMARAKGKDYFEGMQTEWWNGAKENSGFGTIPFANELQNESVQYDSEKARFDLIYYKGAHLLHDLHEQVGHQTFVTFLRSAQASFKWKFTNTENLAGMLRHITKQDFSDYFEKNYWGLGLPKRRK